eukprot:m.455167 g.455167  ORF g.455167 m.455167 type:complete len:82 (+) comp20817_c0_seq1:610-855(+)
MHGCKVGHNDLNTLTFTKRKVPFGMRDEQPQVGDLRVRGVMACRPQQPAVGSLSEAAPRSVSIDPLNTGYSQPCRQIYPGS